MIPESALRGAVTRSFHEGRTTQKRPEGPLEATVCGLAVEASADALRAARVDLAVFPDGQPKLAVHIRKDQFVGSSVVATGAAGFYSLVVKVFSQRDQSP